MAKIRVHELAKEIGKTNKDVIDFLIAKGYDVVTAVSVVPESEVANVRAKFGAADPAESAKEKTASPAAPEAGGKSSPGEPSARRDAPEAPEAEPPKKKGFVRVFRSQNATRQLQRRPKKPVPAPVKEPKKPEVQPAENTLVPDKQEEIREEAGIPSLVSEPAAGSAPAAPAASAKGGTTPAAAPAAEEKEAAPAKAEDASAAERKEADQGAEAPAKTAGVSPAAKTAPEAAAKPEAGSAAGKSAETAPASAAEEAPKKEDGGFRNGRILRNVGSFTPHIASSGPSAQRNRQGQGRTDRDGRPVRGQGDRTRTGAAGRGGSAAGRGDRPYGQGDRARTGAAGRSDRPYGQNRGAAPGGPGRGAAGGRTYQGAQPGRGAQGTLQGRSRGPAPAGKSDTDGSLARKTTRDFRKDGKEREKNREERRELGHHGEMSGRQGTQKRQFNRVPKALQHRQPTAPSEKKEETVTEIRIPERITVRDLAEKMKIAPAVIIKELFMKGDMVTVNHELPFEKAEAIAMDHDIICEQEEKEDVIGELLAEADESEETMVSRPPVVCVMGHVDHGKTSLLDAIRDTHVTDREAGGITQHIGAYMVSVNGRKITFLDTPGHEAFTAMRMRGANATDIAVLVVAADDGVMPQTVEAINHAKAAGTEIIVAVNKIDKPSANVDRVKQELSEYGLISEDWGGSTVFCPVSAKTREGLDNLLEMILLTADMHELKANPDRKARGIVLEARLDKGRGPLASILVQKGTLHQGDFIACGAASGKVRAMTDEKGKRLHKATPSMPVEIIGLSSVPEAGEILVSLDSDKEAKDFAAVFVSEGKKNLIEATKTQMSLDDLFNQIKEGSLKELPIVVKADVQGSVEAVSQSLLKLSNDEVVVKVIHGGVGAINESDVSLASASNAIIIGFNVRPDATARAMADHQKVDIHLYNVIYEAIEDVERALNGMRAAVYEEKIQGHAEIRQMFKASGVGNIAGGYIKDGVFTRTSKVRVFRGEEKLYEGELASLKRFKDDVKEVREGFECGFVFKDWGDFQVDDTVEAYTMVEVPRT